MVASLPAAGKRSLAELLRELTRDAPLLARLSIGPTEQDVHGVFQKIQDDLTHNTTYQVRKYPLDAAYISPLLFRHVST